ncbi:hypothetical protein AG1IA_08621 [Rhizoctonia solani AG-1 IA]|uniref:Uncharacterized protein n=1 Tax=Thanatephorus cucumeris (strain AG1-IA) TaxID=983506 RepID=L8WKM9_THACA|nr:hypothetical protein AG1IA_08621 [Rhizoctonia solani AG-1 IA]
MWNYEWGNCAIDHASSTKFFPNASHRSCSGRARSWYRCCALRAASGSSSYSITSCYLGTSKSKSTKDNMEFFEQNQSRAWREGPLPGRWNQRRWEWSELGRVFLAVRGDQEQNVQQSGPAHPRATIDQSYSFGRGIITALLTNPIWVVKVRVFTTQPGQPGAYRGLWAISAAAKLVAMTSTYPLQVVRSRMQNHATMHLYPTIPLCISRTWRDEGIRGFYRGLATNFIRVLPNTCVTFVVYENLAWLMRQAALSRRDEPIEDGVVTS